MNEKSDQVENQSTGRFVVGVSDFSAAPRKQDFQATSTSLSSI